MLEQGFKITGAVVAAIAIVIAVIIGSILLWAMVSNGTADTRGAAHARNAINGNGDYRISSYDDFFNLFASIKTGRTIHDGACADLRANKNNQILVTNARAAANNLAANINQYDVNVRKFKTLGQFRDDSLPVYIQLRKSDVTC